MIRREGEALVLEGAVTVDTVPGLIGAADVREAARSHTELRLVNLPAPMQNLAKLYGVSELLQFPAA